MKKIILPISALFVVGLSHGQTLNLSTNENYVYSKTYLDYNGASASKTAETVQYFDGLGRAKQVVNVKASPTGKDVVSHIEYDGFGRQVDSWLPAPMNTLNGGIQAGVKSSAMTYYGDNFAFGHSNLEASPLDRVLSQVQPGTDWQAHPVTFNYDANVDGEVRKFTAIFNYTTFESKLSLSPSYGSAQLYKNTVTDEDGNTTIEYKNGQGQVLMVRKVVSATENADTYYVYNDYNQLAYVIPPLAVEAVKSLTTGTFPDVTLNNLCYQYKYDGRNRLVEKKLPGKDWEHMVYDKADRLVATQDANLRSYSKWLFTKYDKFGRILYTGISIDNGDRKAVQEWITNTYGTNIETAGTYTQSGLQIYYANTAYPQNIESILSVNYYDTYPAGTPGFTPEFPSNTLLTDDSSLNVSTKSLPVASYVKNIENDNWTKNYTWYDQKGRAVGSHSINHLGGYTKTESELDFSGTPQKVYTYHLRKEGESGIAVKKRFVYDAQNRLWQHYHQVDNNTEELLAENSYNELSQLANKKVGNNLQSIDYTYNIRGWMTHINKDQMALGNLGGKLFSYNIKYNQKEGIENPDQVQFSGKNVKAKYNGNIAEVDWRAVEVIGQNPSTTPERYGYAYDNLNRLTAGYYQNPNNPNSKENTESLDYDLNGNITDLYRTSVISYGNNTATVIDDLSYTYAEGGNKLTGITDSSQNQTGYEGYPSFSNTIPYDPNGNMLSMAGKRISSIQYNFLNLPNEINMDLDFPFSASHTYRADGSKLRKNTVSTVSGYHNAIVTTEVTDYLDGFQYRNTKVETLGGGGGPGDVELLLAAPVETRRAMEMEAFYFEFPVEPADPGIINPIGGIAAILKTQDLQFFPTAEGFYDYQKNQYIYQYKDHLGNNRVSFARNSAGVLEITDANDYYPFGMNHLKTGNAFFGGSYKAYKYNGKELQETGMYDYGARFYMPDIGRWGVVDPLAETSRRWNPYNYAYNNPIMFIDPDGRQGTDWIRQNVNGASTWTYDPNVQTVAQAEAAGYQDVTAVSASATISSNGFLGAGGYSYTLNEGGSVTNNSDGSGINNTFVTGAGTTINAPSGTFMSEQKLDFTESLSNSNNFFVKLGYGIANNAYVTAQIFDGGLMERPEWSNPLGGNYGNLDGTPNYQQADALVNTVATAAPYARGAKVVNSLMPEGLSVLSRLEPATGARGVINNTLNRGVDYVNGTVGKGMIARPIVTGAGNAAKPDSPIRTWLKRNVGYRPQFN